MAAPLHQRRWGVAGRPIPWAARRMPTEQEVINHLVSKYQPEAIVIVGSRADGHARPGSDWDLYVLLSPQQSAPRGPLPAPEEFDGDLLDVATIRLPIEDSEVELLFGPNLQYARVPYDNAESDGARICSHARDIYARGRRLAPEEVQRRKHEMSRNIARMKARADEPGPFFEAVTYVFYTSHRYWYEVLHGRWSVSIHRAMDEISRLDPGFHRHLETLIESASPAARIEAAEAIFSALFVGEAERPGTSVAD